MKKLFGFVVLCFVSVVSFASAQEWRSLVGDNVANDIDVGEKTICVAMNGGVEKFSKDGSNLPGESTPWKVYTTLNSDLPRNFVNSIAADTIGNIWAMGEGWFSCFSGNMSTGKSAWVPIGGVQSVEDIARGSDGVIWVIMTLNNKRGLYCQGMRWEYVGLSSMVPLIDLSEGASRIAVGGRGTGADSAFCTLWGTCPNGIFSYDGISGTTKFWQVGKELTAGWPVGISAQGDTVLVSGQYGVYVFLAGKLDRTIAYSSELSGRPSKKGSVAFYRNQFYVGEVNGSLWSTGGIDGWREVNEASGIFYQSINCLATDGEKLYIGSNNKMWIYDGIIFTQKSITGVHYPHNNNITHINADNAGRVLVGSYSGGYRYDVDANSPFLNNSSTQNVGGEVLTSFVDNKGAQWIGRDGSIERNGIKINLPTMPYGLNNPYWLVKGVASSSASDMWLVTTNPFSVQIYAGEGTWANPNPYGVPVGLANQKILSVNSTGKHLFIATDSAIYFYDFMGIWATQKLGYSNNRKVCGDESIGIHAWIAEGSVLYSVGGADISVNGSCPWSGRIINDIVLDSDHDLWVATDSGAYCITTAGSAINVPMDKLADRFVKTIYVVNTASEKQIWFGTKGGLTVWHQPNSSTSIVPRPTAVRSSFQVSSPVRSFDLLGRSTSIMPNRMATLSGVRIIQQNGVNKFIKALTTTR